MTEKWGSSSSTARGRQFFQSLALCEPSMCLKLICCINLGIDLYSRTLSRNRLCCLLRYIDSLKTDCFLWSYVWSIKTLSPIGTNITKCHAQNRYKQLKRQTLLSFHDLKFVDRKICRNIDKRTWTTTWTLLLYIYLCCSIYIFYYCIIHLNCISSFSIFRVSADIMKVTGHCCCADRTEERWARKGHSNTQRARFGAVTGGRYQAPSLGAVTRGHHQGPSPGAVTRRLH